MLLLRAGILLVGINLSLVAPSEFINHIASDVAELHFIEYLYKVVVGSLVRSLDNDAGRVVGILDVAQTLFILFLDDLLFLHIGSSLVGELLLEFLDFSDGLGVALEEHLADAVLAVGSGKEFTEGMEISMVWGLRSVVQSIKNVTRSMIISTMGVKSTREFIFFCLLPPFLAIIVSVFYCSAPLREVMRL